MKRVSILGIFSFMVVTFIFSCSSGGDEPVNPPKPPKEDKTTSITLAITGNKTEIKKGEALSFVVKNQKDEVLNNGIAIFVDDAKIEGTSYKFDTVKEYTVYAEYKSIKSTKVTIKVVASNVAAHTTKVLIEDYTGTWCGYCGGMAYIVEEVTKQHKNAIPVALHYGNRGRQKDPFHFRETGRMIEFFKVNGFPTLKLNRNTYVNDIMKQTEEALSKEVNLGLAISSSLSDQDLTVKVKVHYTSKGDGTNKLVVYLLENGLVAPQANYYDNDPDSPLYKKGNPIEDFEHNHVARKVLTDIFGDEIPADKTIADATYEKEFNITLPSNIKDSSKLDIVAFVVGSNFKAINAQKAKVGEDQPFD